MLLLLIACDPDPNETGNPTDDTADTSSMVGDEQECAEAEARLGYRACVHRVDDEDTFNGVTISSSSVDQLRVGKYMVPAIDDARVPGVFLDVNYFQLHYDFLVKGFPDDFSGLTTSQYESLILYPETREFYAGTYSLYVTDAGVFYGFTVWDDPSDESSTVTMEQVAAAYEGLQARFGLDTLAWVPNSENQMEAAAGWDDAPFPIQDPAEVLYEAYNPGEAYGYLRLFTLDEFITAEEEASFSWQDIIVIDEAPEDIERPVSGIITGTRQGTLSHLSVRSATRGTPNCYISEPLTALAEWQDQLVHLDCGETDYSIEAATEEDANTWWTEIRPDQVIVCDPDITETSMPGLLEMDTTTEEARHQNICTWGTKGSNLATLYQRIDSSYQIEGFVIPFYYYQRFMDEGTWEVDLGDGQGVTTHSLQETIDAWHADETFLNDAQARRGMLEELEEAMMSATIPADIEAAIAERFMEVYADENQAVRFRSSSNAEDDLFFTAAGIYESHTGCLADDLDGNSAGPSHCDEDEEDEETFVDAVRASWATLWGVTAWEERSWFSIDQSMVAMALLVNPRSNNEQANAICFTGNPTTATDDRYLVQAQPGELEVASAEAGVYPESNLLTVEDGVVVEIDRVSESSTGEIALTDAQLAEFGAELWTINEVFPLDYDVPEGYNVIWDTEWKVLEDGRIIIKQIRPFMRAE